MAWTNYNTVTDDLVTLLSAGVASVDQVIKESTAVDYLAGNLSLLDVRLASVEVEPRSGQDYNTNITFEVQCTTIDLASHADAATLRNTIMSAAIDVIRGTPLFSSGLLSTLIGDMAFDRQDSDNAFMALGTFQVICLAYVDRS